MWSRKPTPVRGVPAPDPSRPSRERDVGLPGRAVRSPRRGSLIGPAILPDARLHRLGVARRSPPRARSAPPARPARRAAGPIRTSPCAGGSARADSPEAKRAAPPVGRHVVGAGDVVAERRPGLRPDEQAAGACGRAAPAPPRPRPTSCRCSGAKRLGERQRGARGPARRRARQRLAGRGRELASASSSASSGAHGHHERSRRRARPAPQVERHERGSAPAVGDDERRRSGRRSRRSRRRRDDLALGLLHAEVAGAGDHVDAAGPSRSRRRARRPRARRPSGSTASTPHSAHAARITGCSPRRADDDLADARGARGHGAHHDGARVRRAPAGHVDRGAVAPGRRAARRVWPSGKETLASASSPASATARDVGDRQLEPGAHVRVERRQRRRELLRRRRAAAPVAAAEARARSAAAPRRRSSRTSATISRTASATDAPPRHAARAAAAARSARGGRACSAALSAPRIRSTQRRRSPPP